MEFWKISIHHYEFDSFSILKEFSDICGSINKYKLLKLCNETCQHLDNLFNLVNQYFSNDQWLTLQNNADIKFPFNVQDGPMDFIIIEYVIEYEKFIDLVSDSILQLTFKEQYLPKFGVTLQKNIQSYLKRLLNTPSFSNYIFVSGCIFFI